MTGNIYVYITSQTEGITQSYCMTASVIGPYQCKCHGDKLNKVLSTMFSFNRRRDCPTGKADFSTTVARYASLCRLVLSLVKHVLVQIKLSPLTHLTILLALIGDTLRISGSLWHRFAKRFWVISIGLHRVVEATLMRMDASTAEMWKLMVGFKLGQHQWQK